MSLTVFSVAVLITSLGAGVVGAILGLGGGILLVPILTIFYGVDPVLVRIPARGHRARPLPCQHVSR